VSEIRKSAYCLKQAVVNNLTHFKKPVHFSVAFGMHHIQDASFEDEQSSSRYELRRATIFLRNSSGF
jgi:hypothetical protein